MDNCSATVFLWCNLSKRKNNNRYEPDDSGSWSLRDAIATATDGDTINYDPVDGHPIILTSGQLEIGKPITITGNDTAKTIIDGNNSFRVFYTSIGTQEVTLQNIIV